MPSNRKRIARGRTGRNGITEVDYFFYSWGPYFEAEDYEKDKTEDGIKSFWNKHREMIMERYLNKIQPKGKDWACCRPWAWWKWSMPESQQPIQSGALPSLKNWDHRKNEFAWIENDRQYLKRLSLLEPWELAAA
jgi:hypothetical protein